MKKVIGYKKRPWWIRGFSLFFVLLPLIALALKLYQYEPSHLFNFEMWIEAIRHFEVNNWLLVFLSLSIGLLIYNASKLSLIILSALFLIILIINLVLLKKLVLWSIILPILFWFSPFRSFHVFGFKKIKTAYLSIKKVAELLICLSLAYW